MRGERGVEREFYIEVHFDSFLIWMKSEFCFSSGPLQRARRLTRRQQGKMESKRISRTATGSLIYRRVSGFYLANLLLAPSLPCPTPSFVSCVVYFL